MSLCLYAWPCLTVSKSLCLDFYLYVCLSVFFLSVYLCLCTFLSAFCLRSTLFQLVCVSLSIDTDSLPLSFCLSVGLPACLSICLYVALILPRSSSMERRRRLRGSPQQKSGTGCCCCYSPWFEPYSYRNRCQLTLPVPSPLIPDLSTKL